MKIEEWKAENQQEPKSYVYTGLTILVTVSVLSPKPIHMLLVSTITAIAGAAFFMFLRFVQPGGIGFGDVRLAGLIGFGLAPISPYLAVGAFLGAFVAGAVVMVALSACFKLYAFVGHTKAHAVRSIPFGPALLFSTLMMEFLHFLAISPR